jgi:hypothetical protein
VHAGSAILMVLRPLCRAHAQGNARPTLRTMGISGGERAGCVTGATGGDVRWIHAASRLGVFGSQTRAAGGGPALAWYRAMRSLHDPRHSLARLGRGLGLIALVLGCNAGTEDSACL